MYTLSAIPFSAQSVSADSFEALASWVAVAGRLGVVTLCEQDGVRISLDFSRHDLFDPFCWRGGSFWPHVLRVTCDAPDADSAVDRFQRAFLVRADSSGEAADRLHARLSRRLLEPDQRGDVYPLHSVLPACAGMCAARTNGHGNWRAEILNVTPQSAPVFIWVMVPHEQAKSAPNWVSNQEVKHVS